MASNTRLSQAALLEVLCGCAASAARWRGGKVLLLSALGRRVAASVQTPGWGAERRPQTIQSDGRRFAPHRSRFPNTPGRMRRGDEGVWSWGWFALFYAPHAECAARTGSGRAASGRRTVVRWRVQAGWAENGARHGFLPLTPSALRAPAPGGRPDRAADGRRLVGAIRMGRRQSDGKIAETSPSHSTSARPRAARSGRARAAGERSEFGVSGPKQPPSRSRCAQRIRRERTKTSPRPLTRPAAPAHRPPAACRHGG